MFTSDFDSDKCFKIKLAARVEKNVTVMITPANGVLYIYTYRHYIAMNVVLTSPSRQSLIDNIYAITGKEREGWEGFVGGKKEGRRKQLWFLCVLKRLGMRAEPVRGIAVGSAH